MARPVAPTTPGTGIGSDERTPAPQQRTVPSAMIAQLDASAAAMPVKSAIPVTSTGIGFAGVAVPLPICPEPPSPQQRAVWSASTAQVWLEPGPAAIATAFWRPDTGTGVGESTMAPLPRVPLVLAPQHRTEPSCSRAQLCSAPAVMACAPVKPATSIAPDELGPIVPLPS